MCDSETTKESKPYIIWLSEKKGWLTSGDTPLTTDVEEAVRLTQADARLLCVILAPALPVVAADVLAVHDEVAAAMAKQAIAGAPQIVTTTLSRLVREGPTDAE